ASDRAHTVMVPWWQVAHLRSSRHLAASFSRNARPRSAALRTCSGEGVLAAGSSAQAASTPKRQIAVAAKPTHARENMCRPRDFRSARFISFANVFVAEVAQERDAGERGGDVVPVAPFAKAHRLTVGAPHMRVRLIRDIGDVVAEARTVRQMLAH